MREIMDIIKLNHIALIYVLNCITINTFADTFLEGGLGLGKIGHTYTSDFGAYVSNVSIQPALQLGLIHKISISEKHTIGVGIAFMNINGKLNSGINGENYPRIEEYKVTEQRIYLSLPLSYHLPMKSFELAGKLSPAFWLSKQLNGSGTITDRTTGETTPYSWTGTKKNSLLASFFSLELAKSMGDKLGIALELQQEFLAPKGALGKRWSAKQALLKVRYQL